MTYTVSREVRTLVTLHEGTDTTARSEAASQLVTTLESLAETTAIRTNGSLETAVYEHPAAPFDPYTVSVSFRAVVDVEAAEAASAAEATHRGAAIIEDVFERSSLESVSYPSDATATKN
ncbi:hypothetical protein EL22_10975 [Halostagnicola sp. A56]|uniref:hypothetical protein n=1 Tax=Halostagnicola sp. A56 TaxID=1495067 RepID=UPI0004A08BEE|nr:hypothetical protein [Halostagnicola sp. A56]KDE60098.1 hypothetical protein EL22_10975 [Halostagnicola sp. A56]